MIKENINNFISLINNIIYIKNNKLNNFDWIFEYWFKNLKIKENKVIDFSKQIIDYDYISILENLFPNLIKSNLLKSILKMDTNFDDKLKNFIKINTVYNENIKLNLNNFKSIIFYQFCILNDKFYLNNYMIKNLKKIFFNKNIDYNNNTISINIINNEKEEINLDDLLNILKDKIPLEIKLNINNLKIKLKKYFYFEKININKDFINKIVKFILNLKIKKYIIFKNNLNNSQNNLDNLKKTLKNFKLQNNKEKFIKNKNENIYLILKDIFKNFSRIKNNYEKNDELFDNIKISKNYLNYNEFNKFIYDYKIYIIQKQYILELFKFIKINKYGIDFTGFFNLIKWLAFVNDKEKKFSNSEEYIINFIEEFKLDNKNLLIKFTNQNQNILNKSIDYIRNIDKKHEVWPLFARSKLKKKVEKYKNFDFKIQDKLVIKRLYKPIINKFKKRKKNSLTNDSKSILINSLKSSTNSKNISEVKNSYFKRKKLKKIINDQNLINWEKINNIDVNEISLTKKLELSYFFNEKIKKKENWNKSLNQNNYWKYGNNIKLKLN